jgi:pimeloyl-ACP methyl ester carboxylesterase
LPKVKSIDGTEIYYEVMGEGDIALVLIGGLGATIGRITWRYQLELSEEYKLILIDIAGHGNSGKDREKYTMELYGQDVKAVIEELDLKEVILVGWSLGGAVILEAATLISERILGLIPVDSLFPNSLYTELNEEAIEGAIKPFEEDFVAAFTNLLNNHISDKFDPKDVEMLHSLAPTLDKRSMNSAFRQLMKWNMHNTLPKVKKPIKSIIAGRTIEVFSKEEYEKYFQAVYTEGLGHLLAYEDPIVFNEVFRGVIKEFEVNK